MSEARNRKGLKRHDSIYVEVTTVNSSPPVPSNLNRGNLVHVAEVHDSKSKLIGSSGEDSWAQQRQPAQKKQPVQLRKRFRQPRKGSETDTLSEVESGEASGTDTPQKPLRQDTQDTSDRSSHSQTLVVPSARHIKRGMPVDVNTSSMDTSSTKDSNDYTAVRKTRRREPRRGSLTDTLSEATDSESTVARRPVAPPRPSLDTTGDSQELHSQESIEQPRPPLRVKKLRRKRKSGDESGRETDDASIADQQSDIDPNFQQPSTTGEKVVVRVEGCDSLRFLDFCRCPTVRLHIVDPVTGDYKISSCDPDTPVPPVQTQPFNMKLHRSVRPTWEEDLIIEEPPSLIASKQSLLIFELFDFVKGNTVAWAFLKLIASNGASNLGRPLRLQLFKPSRNGKQPSSSGPKCYSWWSKGKYTQYKSTLYVSVSCISSTSDLPVATSPTSQKKQPETHPQNSGVEESGVGQEEEEVLWARYPGQSCKFPNSQLVERECGKDGALCLVFSHSGRLLAVPTSAGIQVYTIPSAQLFLSLDKQQGLVYDVAWSEDDEYLLSVSADSTACLWHIKRKVTHAIKILAHPSYVYCCCWISLELFASGCSDGVVRVWSLNSNTATNNARGNSARRNGRKDSSTPVEFLAQHTTRVNSLVACERSTATQRTESTDVSEVAPVEYILVSADSSGIIIVWRFDSAAKKFELEQEVKLKELIGQVINKVVLVGKKGEVSRILVQSKDSIIRLVDIGTRTTLQVYQGAYIVKSKSGGCSVCGCGRRVWAPSEDGSLVAWDYATGERVATYAVTSTSPHTSLSLALHPLDHMLAFTSHSPSDYPTLKILNFDREGDGSSVGLVILEPSRRSALKWSALDSPLYEIPPVKIQPPPGLKPVAISATPSSRLSPVPTPLPRTTRRFSGEGPKVPLESVATALINLPVKTVAKPGETKKQEDNSSVSSKIGVKASQIAEGNKQPDQGNSSRDSRLSDIIGKMDLILIQASP